MRIGEELKIAVENFEKAPKWFRDLPIENTDRVISKRVRETAPNHVGPISLDRDDSSDDYYASLVDASKDIKIPA